MKSKGGKELDFIIDKLTNSIENRITGESFQTEVTKLSQKELSQMNKKDWKFDWGQRS